MRFVQLLAESGLAGRGGASFPTGAKLKGLIGRGPVNCLVVNAMEGEPSSMKDSVLLTYSPHLVLDGAQLVALALGARRIVVSIPRQQESLGRAVALALAERAETDLSTKTVEIATRPGRYIAGEESALVSWLGGGDGLPEFRIDKAQPLSMRDGSGLALVHNPETLAHVALIARHGARWFRTRGTHDAPGSCLVTLSGAVERPGVFEVPFGSPVLSIVERAMPRSPVTAVLIGGFSGTWLSGAQLQVPYSQEELSRIGASIGAGVLIAVDGSVCAVAESARVANYMAGESAGQCGPCVFGLSSIAGDLSLAADGVVDAGLERRLRTRLALVEGRGACKHPDGAVRMVRSALRTFEEDFSAHLAGRPCAARGRPSVMGLCDPDQLETWRGRERERGS